MSSLVFLECKCAEAKTHHLTFDGGSSGQYTVDMCEKCNLSENKSFLITSQELM